MSSALETLGSNDRHEESKWQRHGEQTGTDHCLSQRLVSRSSSLQTQNTRRKYTPKFISKKVNPQALHIFPWIIHQELEHSAMNEPSLISTMDSGQGKPLLVWYFSGDGTGLYVEFSFLTQYIKVFLWEPRHHAESRQRCVYLVCCLSHFVAGNIWNTDGACVPVFPVSLFHICPALWKFSDKTPVLAAVQIINRTGHPYQLYISITRLREETACPNDWMFKCVFSSAEKQYLREKRLKKSMMHFFVLEERSVQQVIHVWQSICGSDWLSCSQVWDDACYGVEKGCVKTNAAFIKCITKHTVQTETAVLLSCLLLHKHLPLMASKWMIDFYFLCLKTFQTHGTVKQTFIKCSLSFFFPPSYRYHDTGMLMFQEQPTATRLP